MDLCFKKAIFMWLKRFVVKDYFAIIGVTAAITAATGLVAWNALSESGKTNEDVSSVTASLQPISVPIGELPEANGESLKHTLAANGQEAERQKSKPVITIEEIDPQDRKQSIKARLQEAKAKAAKQMEAKKRAIKKKAGKSQADGMNKATAEHKGKKAKKKQEKAKADKNAKAKQVDKAKGNKKDTQQKNSEQTKEMKAEENKDGISESMEAKDPGKIVFGAQPEPFPTPMEKLKIPEPMELINANSTLLTNIVNSKSGPSPEELHGTWEVMPCHSSVGVIAKRSFKTNELTAGTGAYYEVVQFYSDPEKKVFGPRTETTVYVSLDEKHMLAAVNANTNLPQFSVLRKVSSEIQEPEETEDEMSEADFPGETDEISSVQSDKKTDNKQKEKAKQDADKKSDKDGMKTSDKATKKDSEKGSKKSGKKAAKKSDKSMKKADASMKKADSAMKKTDAAMKKTDAAMKKTDAAMKKTDAVMKK